MVLLSCWSCVTLSAPEVTALTSPSQSVQPALSTPYTPYRTPLSVSTKFCVCLQLSTLSPRYNLCVEAWCQHQRSEFFVPAQSVHKSLYRSCKNPILSSLCVCARARAYITYLLLNYHFEKCRWGIMSSIKNSIMLELKPPSYQHTVWENQPASTLLEEIGFFRRDYKELKWHNVKGIREINLYKWRQPKMR